MSLDERVKTIQITTTLVWERLREMGLELDRVTTAYMIGYYMFELQSSAAGMPEGGPPIDALAGAIGFQILSQSKQEKDNDDKATAEKAS